MQTSSSIAILAAALIKAQAKFPAIPKTKEVIFQTQRGSINFKYAPLEEMISVLRPILAEFELGFTQGADGDSIVTTLFHSSGEWISHRMPLPEQPTAMAYGSQFTYRRRYSLKAALGIETDEDDADNTFVDDGKKRKNTPNAGAFDNIPKERHEYVNRVASSIVDCFNADQPQEAFKAYLEVTDNMEKLGVWSFLDSKMRRRLKAMQAEKLKNV